MSACHDEYDPDEVAPASEPRPSSGPPGAEPSECHDVYPPVTWAPAEAEGAPAADR